MPLILDEAKAGGSAPPLRNAPHTRMIKGVSQADEESNLAAVFVIVHRTLDWRSTTRLRSVPFV